MSQHDDDVRLQHMVDAARRAVAFVQGRSRFDGPTTLDRYFGVKEALEDLLGTRVDLATPAMLKPRLQREVDREAVRVA